MFNCTRYVSCDPVIAVMCKVKVIRCKVKIIRYKIKTWKWNQKLPVQSWFTSGHNTGNFWSSRFGNHTEKWNGIGGNYVFHVLFFDTCVNDRLRKSAGSRNAKKLHFTRLRWVVTCYVEFKWNNFIF